jgi:hypothetical protein
VLQGHEMLELDRRRIRQCSERAWIFEM